MEVNGIQLWTVPSDGTYRIEVWGAQGAFISGGSYSAGSEVEGGGGKGSRMRGDFTLNKGDKLKILVGQMGRGGGAASGGGGGTFVAEYDDTALIIAGGGGGNRRNSTFNTVMNAVTSTTGVDGLNSSNTGGSGGNGGTAGNNSGSGAGFTGNGVPSSDSRPMSITPTAASSFTNGGIGGQLQFSGIYAYIQGGFGGGGAGGWGGTGGGGGYSGGGGDINSNSGYAGGGGSYNSGTNQSNEGGLWESHGKCIITKL